LVADGAIERSQLPGGGVGFRPRAETAARESKDGSPGETSEQASS
jgi:hypothetical protein